VNLPFEPCLPRPAKVPPTGPDWIHEINHDGFRILAHKDGAKVRLITRNSYDLALRFPLAVAAMAAPPAGSEVIVCGEDGLSMFELLRFRHYDHLATLCAFDLLQLNDTDVRPLSVEERKTELKALLRKEHPGITFNRTFDVEGSIVFHHACKLGCEGIVSKRLGSKYRGDRSADWIKAQEPGGTGCEARGRRRLEHIGQTVAMTPRNRASNAMSGSCPVHPQLQTFV
jgi:bifunctional non-homologous end joining protein LigD